MMKFLALALLLLSTFSCQPNEGTKEKKQSLRVNILSDPKTIDPRKTRDLNERALTQMLFEGLMRVGQDGKSACALAKDVSVDAEGTRYVFHLKEACWTNGDRIRPKDFIYAWQTALSPQFPSENAYQLFCIKNAEEIKKGLKSPEELGALEIDENTLQIDLVRPVPYFLELLSFSIFFPVHEKMDDSLSWNGENCDSFISCGPFSLSTWKHNNFIEVLKNSSYWDEKNVSLESLYMTMVTEDTEVRMFENGELDFAGSPLSALPVDLIQDLKRKNLCFFPFLATAFFRINIEKYPLHNVDLRRALALAINRQDLVDYVLQGGQDEALSLVPNSKVSFFPKLDIKNMQEEAKVLWNKNASSAPQKITLLYASNQKNHLVAQTIQQNWKEVLGIQVILEASEPKVYYSRLNAKDYQIALGSWVADYNDPESFLEVFKHKNASTNNTQWESAYYIRSLDLANKQTGLEREKTLLECESYLLKEMPIIPIYHLKGLYLKNEHLKGIVISPIGNIDFKWAYMDYPEK